LEAGECAGQDTVAIDGMQWYQKVMFMQDEGLLNCLEDSINSKTTCVYVYGLYRLPQDSSWRHCAGPVAIGREEAEEVEKAESFQGMPVLHGDFLVA
jgi:hypothetical protein